MKQYTSEDQTAKLIELGFPRPKPSFYQNGATWIQCDGNYSIGELIAFLGVHLMYIKSKHNDWYEVAYKENYYNNTGNVIYGELIDKLFYACVTLKEKRVI